MSSSWYCQVDDMVMFLITISECCVNKNLKFEMHLWFLKDSKLIDKNGGFLDEKKAKHQITNLIGRLCCSFFKTVENRQ